MLQEKQNSRRWKACAKNSQTRNSLPSTPRYSLSGPVERQATTPSVVWILRRFQRSAVSDFNLRLVSLASPIVAP
jgi:hypothetical protein